MRSAFALLTAPFVLLAHCGGTTSVPIGTNQTSAYKLMSNADGSPTGDGRTCAYLGGSGAVGDNFRASCNECRCTAQGAECTTLACDSASSSPSPSSRGCSDGKGGTRAVGESWSNGNATCRCVKDGDAPLCAASGPDSRNSPPSACTDQFGQPRAVGARWTDGCNTCFCDQQANWVCTGAFCAPCGGIAGTRCPDVDDVCIDDPNDSCDPNNGGADCAGFCRNPN